MNKIKYSIKNNVARKIAIKFQSPIEFSTEFLRGINCMKLSTENARNSGESLS